MPVSGLVVTLVEDGAAHRAALSALRAHPCITVHASFTADQTADLGAGPAGDPATAQPTAVQGDGGRSTALRVPIVIDARDAAEEQAVWQWLQDLDGLVFTDLVCSLGDEMAAAAEPMGADGPARQGSADPPQQTPPASALSGTGPRPPCIVPGLSAEAGSDIVQGHPDRRHDGAPLVTETNNEPSRER